MAVTINGTTGITTPDLDSTADITANSVPFGKGASSVSTNTAGGIGALNSTTSGSNNTVLGYQAGYSNTIGTRNTYIGMYAGYTATGTSTNGFNTFVGYRAGFNLTTGYGNTFLGTNNTTGLGSGDLVTTGNHNVILGSYNGNSGGLDVRTSSNNLILSDGEGNWKQLTDSTNTTYRYGDSNSYSWNKSLAGVKTAGSSGSSTKLCQIGPTCALTVKVMAIQSGNQANSAQLVGNITVAYGGGGTVAGTTTATQGNVSGISISYDNGGSPIYTINCTLTYSGAAPTIYYVIEGLSTYNFTPL